ncbi:hypothetical protein MHZ92_09855 [Sporosarcina sp. ACRSL]|uniref:hypothetical protein n=1 Tax=Sporosarcina sp. ACRSL TaxID=2918215 RepID=UPI001EF43E2B|nr:hypothetical protein [Sporosarcina sp. ACRSL]MCG7344439.1 hypothetical protein [Sporosarcina sp. ACRSL]
MFRYWKFLFLAMLSVIVLAACGKTLEEQATEAIAAAKEAFQQHDQHVNEEVDGVSLYKPAGFTIEDTSDAQNIVMKKGDETYLLFINPNEAKDSTLFYDLLKNSKDKERFEEVFTDNSYFGFASVTQKGEDQVELIASVGGVKITTMSKQKNIVANMGKMMEIVSSIQQGT